MGAARLSIRVEFLSTSSSFLAFPAYASRCTFNQLHVLVRLSARLHCQRYAKCVCQQVNLSTEKKARLHTCS